MKATRRRPARSAMEMLLVVGTPARGRLEPHPRRHGRGKSTGKARTEPITWRPTANMHFSTAGGSHLHRKPAHPGFVVVGFPVRSTLLPATANHSPRSAPAARRKPTSSPAWHIPTASSTRRSPSTQLDRSWWMLSRERSKEPGNVATPRPVGGAGGWLVADRQRQPASAGGPTGAVQRRSSPITWTTRPAWRLMPAVKSSSANRGNLQNVFRCSIRTANMTVHSIGKAGGRPWRGSRYDPSGMLEPLGITIDKLRGRLWVPEELGHPRRVEAWWDSRDDQAGDQGVLRRQPVFDVGRDGPRRAQPTTEVFCHDVQWKSRPGQGHMVAGRRRCGVAGPSPAR